VADSQNSSLKKIRKYFVLEKKWGLKHFVFGITSWRVLRWLVFILVVAPLIYFFNQRVNSSVDNFIHGITFSASNPKRIQFPLMTMSIELDNAAAVDFRYADRGHTTYTLILTIAEREYCDGVFIYRSETSYFQRIKLLVLPHSETERLLFGGKLYYFRIYAQAQIPKGKLVTAAKLLNEYPPDLKSFCNLGLSHPQKAMLLLRYVPGTKLRVSIMPDIKPTTANHITGRDKNGKIVFVVYNKIESIYNKNLEIIFPKTCE